MANIVRWDDPFAGIASMHSQLDDMFNNLFSGTPSLPMAQNMATMDVYNEDDKQLVAEVHAPEFTKDDVGVSINKGVLEIKGEKHETEADKDRKPRNYMHRESHASFYRRLVLPEYADEDKVNAEFENGVLKVTIPFKELPKPKQVAISDGKKK